MRGGRERGVGGWRERKNGAEQVFGGKEIGHLELMKETLPEVF